MACPELQLDVRTRHRPMTSSHHVKSTGRLVPLVSAVLLVLLTGCSSKSTMTGIVTTLSADRICVGRPAASGDCFTGASSTDLRNVKTGDCVKVIYRPGSASAASRAIHVMAVKGGAAARKCS